MAILSHNKLFAFSLSGNFNLIGVGLNDWVFHDFNWGSEMLRNWQNGQNVDELVNSAAIVYINK